MATVLDENQPYNPQQQKKGGSGCLKGCLIAFVVVVILAVIAGVLIWQNWKSMAASVGVAAVQQMMDASGLPAEEKAEVMEQVNRVGTALREGDLTMEQLGRIMEQIVESPLVPSLLVGAVEEKYLNDSGLTEEEKTDARATLRRFIQGAMQEQISDEEVDAVMVHIADRQPDGNWKLRDSVTDDQLRAFLADAKAKADEVGIPEDVEEVDPSDELRKIIDTALAAPGDAAPAMEMEAPAMEVEPADSVDAP
jgi:hypothetical protein